MGAEDPDPAVSEGPTPEGEVSLEGRFLRVNRALASILGRAPDELMTLGPLAVTHPGDRDRMVSMLGLMRAGSIGNAKFRQRLVPAGGVAIEVLISGSVVHGDDGAPSAFAFTVQTVAPAGRQSEWESLFAHSRQGIAVIGPDGRHTRVNDAYAAILGYAPADLLGLPWRATVPADCAPEIERAHAEMLTHGGAWLETLGIRRDGSCFEAEIELVSGHDADSTSSGHLCLVRDVGARKREHLRQSELLRLSLLANRGAELGMLIDDAVRTVSAVLQCEVAVVGDADTSLRIVPADGRPSREFSADERGFPAAVSDLLGDLARREPAERGRRAARHDGLTGLPDATSFLERLTHALSGSAEPTLSVLVLGIEAGCGGVEQAGRSIQVDVRRAIAGRIATRLAPDSFLARLGDWSFGILLATRDELAIAAKTRCLLKATSEPVLASDQEHQVHATVGIAVASPGDDACELIDMADRARRRAHELGTDRFELVDFAEYRPDAPVHQLSDEIRVALRGDQLRLRYQPVFNLSDRSIDGVEALLRWEHASRTVLSPDLFLPAARRTGAIVPIGRWVLEQSLGQLAQWNELLAREKPLRLFVNLCARELAEPSLVDAVVEALERRQIAPSQLAIDVSDPLLDVHGPAWRSVDALRQLGTIVVLDQFGGALSSLADLERLPIDMVKLDRSCVAGVADDGRDRATVKASVAVAEARGLGLIACGVETERQARALAALGCDRAQGFLFAEPRAERAVTKLLRWRGEPGGGARSTGATG